ncbi:MAG: hypothetical protein HKN26_09985 [Acidimicrobiales bacterium]|nr:hypothetical protein [Acidimicrobiales bacterium]
MSSTWRSGDSVLFSRASWNNEAPLFLGCNVLVFEEQEEAQNGYRDLCGAAVADWQAVIANAPDPAPLEQVITPAAETLLAEAVAARGEGEPVAIDDDGEFVVNIALPPDTEVSIGSFDAEVDLAAAQSIFTDFELDAGCDGLCTPKDWEAELNRFDGLLGGVRASVDVALDAPFDNGWVVAGWQGDDYRIRVVHWDDDATHFFQCAVDLNEADVDLAPSIIALCVAAEPAWFD